MSVELSKGDFKALSSDTRTAILKLLKDRNHNLSEFSAKLDLAPPTIKKHLDVLVNAGLIEIVNTNHKWKYYKLTRKGFFVATPQATQIFILLSIGFALLIGIAYIFGFGFFSQPNQFGIQQEKLAIPESPMPSVAEDFALGVNSYNREVLTGEGSLEVIGESKETVPARVKINNLDTNAVQSNECEQFCNSCVPKIDMNCSQECNECYEVEN